MCSLLACRPPLWIKVMLRGFSFSHVTLHLSPPCYSVLSLVLCPSRAPGLPCDWSDNFFHVTYYGRASFPEERSLEARYEQAHQTIRATASTPQVRAHPRRPSQRTVVITCVYTHILVGVSRGWLRTFLVELSLQQTMSWLSQYDYCLAQTAYVPSQLSLDSSTLVVQVSMC